MTDIHPQRIWLTKIREMLPPEKLLMVCDHVDSVRIPYGMATFPIGHRLILNNEMVFEFDHPLCEINTLLTYALCEYMNNLELPFIVGFTGNKSFHTHVFCNFKLDFSDMEEKNEIVETLEERGLFSLRNYIANKLFSDYIKSIEPESEDYEGQTYFDASNFQKNKIIREFGGVHEKTGYCKTLVNWKDLADMKTPPFTKEAVYPHEILLYSAPITFKKFLRSWAKQKSEWRGFERTPTHHRNISTGAIQ